MDRLFVAFSRSARSACAISAIHLFVAVGVLATTPGSSFANSVVLNGHTDYVLYVRYLPGGMTLVTGSPDRTIRLWDASGLQPSKIWQTVPEFDAAPSTSIIDLTGDGTTLVRAGATQGSIEEWDFANTKLKKAFRAHAGTVTSVVVSKNGAVLASTSGEELRVFDIQGKQKMGLVLPQYRFLVVALSEDGALLAAAGSNRQLGLFESATGKQLMAFESHAGNVTALAFSSDRKYIVSGAEGSNGDILKVWDITKPDPILTLIPRSSPVRAVAFSPDGTILASANADIDLWKIGSGKLITELTGHTAAIRSLTFAPDGHSLASASDDRSVRIWPVHD